MKFCLGFLCGSRWGGAVLSVYSVLLLVPFYLHNSAVADQVIADCKAFPNYHSACSMTREQMIWEGIKP